MLEGEAEDFYIHASSKTEHTNQLILKHGETFGVFNGVGDIAYRALGEGGVYHEGTKHLAQWQLRIGERQRPLLLSSAVRGNNTVLSVDLTNPSSGGEIMHGTLHLRRDILLWESALYERLTVSNLGEGAVEIVLGYFFDADFVDIFEVRGLRRRERGRLMPRSVAEAGISIGYTGLDDVVRCTRLHFEGPGLDLRDDRVFFRAQLEPHQRETAFTTMRFIRGEQNSKALSFQEAYEETQTAHSLRPGRDCIVRTSNEQFNLWLNRSRADLRMLITETPQGAYPYAGIPWFSTVFGRDGILTARQWLWMKPKMAKGVLNYLAEYQADEVDPGRAAEPGKILHETRLGEMSALGETPFLRYYGTVDATPLFIALAGAYFKRSGDREFLEKLWPSILRALDWIDNYGDLDGDGFVEYPDYGEGLRNHCWMDSDDSIYHRDRRLAEGPLAVSEVQAYVYEAKQSAAEMAEHLNDPDLAQRLNAEAEKLKADFDRAFWIPEMNCYALALDGRKRPCNIRGSNMGHCLFSGIATRQRAKAIRDLLISESFFSGWGIRTKAAGEPRYNPLSYHNGSVWPHDNSLIAHGLARYGFTAAAGRVLKGLFDASTYFPLARIPELFCGLPRFHEAGPTLYPVACSPQAWATGTVPMLLEACLGMKVNGIEGRLVFENPYLPDFLSAVYVETLQVGDSVVDLEINRHDDNYEVSVTARPQRGSVEVILKKTKASDEYRQNGIV